MKEKKEKLQQFLRDVKKGRYGPVEKNSQQFKRLEYEDLTPEGPVITSFS